MALYYAYQAVDSATLEVCGWQSPVPDPTGVLYPGPNAPTALVRLNDPNEDSADNLLAWSGVGITGSQTPTGVVLGAGLSGSVGAGTLTLTTTPTFAICDVDGIPIFSNVGKISLVGLTPYLMGTGHVQLTASTAAIHLPVLGVTTANLVSLGGIFLTFPDNAVEVAEYDGVSYVTIYYYSNYDALAGDIPEWGRVLVAAQDVESENGIYEFNGTSLTKADEPIVTGDIIPVQTGRTWAGVSWLATSATTFAPAAGTPTHSSWTLLIPQDNTEADRWEPLMVIHSVGGMYAREYVTDVSVTATIASVAGERKVIVARAAYLGNPAGDMTTLGDDLNSQFGLPWESTTDVRIRAVVDGANLTIEGLADYTGGSNWRFGLSVTVKITRVL